MPLPNALGTSLFFCFSLFDVPTACCDLPLPKQEDFIACSKTVWGGKVKKEGVCGWMGGMDEV